MTKTIGIIGFGKMGAGLARNLLEKGWVVHGFNRTYARCQELESDGLIPSETMADFMQNLSTPRVVIVMVSAGNGVEETLFGEAGVYKFAQEGDIVIDGGNSYYKDDATHAEKFSANGVHYIDAGISGGPYGARNGACIMVGGKKEIFEQVEDVFKDLSLPDGYAFFPGYGAGHFVKMVHNGIEYGMMQAIAEGFDIMRQSPLSIDLAEVSRIYNKGSVIESRLTKWMEEGFRDFGVELSEIPGAAGQGGVAAGKTGKSEGVWTVEAADELNIPAPVIKASVDAREFSRNNPNFQGKIINALRNKFGGHKIS